MFVTKNQSHILLTTSQYTLLSIISQNDRNDFELGAMLFINQNLLNQNRLPLVFGSRLAVKLHVVHICNVPIYIVLRRIIRTPQGNKTGGPFNIRYILPWQADSSSRLAHHAYRMGAPQPTTKLQHISFACTMSNRTIHSRLFCAR